MKNESQVLPVGLFASFPSQSRTGYVAQGFFLFPGILVGYLIMHLASLFFAVDLFPYTIWVVIISYGIVREFVAAVMPDVFGLTVQRKKGDFLIVISSYVLSIVVLETVQRHAPGRELWNALLTLVPAVVSIYLPGILFGSTELKTAILPTKRSA